MAAASSPRSWTDLPPDLLRFISGSLHDAGDFVRFHAVCQAWRDTLPAPCEPLFLPWLLAPGDHPQCQRRKLAQFHSIFSKSKSIWCAPGTYSRCNNRWLAAEGGVGTWLLTVGGGENPQSPHLVDPFTGSATTLPPLPDKILEYIGCISGVVFADGTVFLYFFDVGCKYVCYIVAAVLRPGEPAWTEVETNRGLMYTGFEESCAVVRHKGAILLVDLIQFNILKLRPDGDLLQVHQTHWNSRETPHAKEYRKKGIYTLESRGEVLAVSVAMASEVDDSGDLRALADAISVRIYALVDGEEDHPRWVARDAGSLSDRVLFLGSPTSFAVDAARFGEDDDVRGGCAYLVLTSRDAGWTTMPGARCVYRYSFEDGGATVVEELPSGDAWSDHIDCMFFVPQPFGIAPVQEIRERLLQAPNSNHRAPSLSGSIFVPRKELKLHNLRIYVGNIPPLVGIFELRKFFCTYIDSFELLDARVISDTRTNHSWGFGFVTISTIAEPDEIFSTLDKTNFFGQTLRVKYGEERPEGPFVMQLLASNKKTASAQNSRQYCCFDLNTSLAEIWLTSRR